MSEASRGLPLLSGPPPQQESSGRNADACRKCSKEFNVLFTRSRKCNHCGYAYCHSCTDYQALMPRAGNNSMTGYDPMNVCGFCIDYLTITASGRTQLKGMAMSRLKNYINAYSIKTERVVEKDDLIDAIIAARGPDGCLPRANENYYRKNSVPNRASSGSRRGFFNSSRSGQASSSSQPPPPPRRDTRPEFARPDLEPDSPPPPPPRDSRPYASRNTPQRPQQQPPPQQQYSPPPGPPPRPHSAYGYAPPPGPPPQFHTPPPHGQSYSGYNGQDHYYQGVPSQPQYHFPQGQHQSPPQNYDNAHYPGAPPRTPPRHANQQQQSNPGPPPPPPPRPRAASTAPPPSLEEMLTMTPEAISSMSIGNLKKVLFTNHVNAGQILEKSELVKKVMQLVEDEKRERERQRRIEEMEEMERVQREMDAARERENAERERLDREREEREREHDTWGRARRGEPNQGPRPDQDGSDYNSEQSDDHHGYGGDYGDRDRSNESRRSHSGPSRSASPANPPKPTATASSTHKTTPSFSKTVERTGLCVVCQDEEANIAIVDCGHLAMCRGCSDLIMSSSRECPLCRTRIVTEARLLRIFKT